MADAIRFLLNGEKRELRDVPPFMTVLQYLRTVEHMTGTKEGCAEGDCGACTVVIGEAVNGKMRWRAANSCILLLGRIDGKYLLTVEGVKNPDGTLHPVQQAMVDMHGTQCGFCSPGFIMSLFTLYHWEGDKPATDEDIFDILSGNLCRCTGYRPILDVARKIACGKKDRFTDHEADIVKALEAMQRTIGMEYEYNSQKYFAPRSLSALTDLIEEHADARLVAGATDLGLEVSKEFKEFPVLIGLSEVPELNKIEETNDALIIGAAVPYSTLVKTLEKWFPPFAKIVRRIGSNQIRTVGTVGGNICNAAPIADSIPSLMALGATIRLRSKDGVRELPIEDFYVGYRQTVLKPNEFLEYVTVPKLPADHIFKAYKLARRRDLDVASITGAFNIKVDDKGIVTFARLGYGGGGAVPQLATNAQDALIGKPWTQEVVDQAMEAMVQDFIKRRPKGDYRSDIALNLLKRVYVETTTPEADLEVWKL